MALNSLLHRLPEKKNNQNHSLMWVLPSFFLLDRMLFLNLHGEGIGVAELFWGLDFLPLALLVYRRDSCLVSWASGSPSTASPT